MRYVGAVVAVMVLHEDLRPDELGRRDKPDFRAEQLGFRSADEPFVGDVRRHRRHVRDHVDEHLAARDAVEPALVNDLHVEAVLLEEVEHFERVSGLGEDVDILGRPVDPRVAGERIGAGHQERDLRLRHQLQHFRIEGFRRRWRLDEGAFRPRERLLVHARAKREGGGDGSEGAVNYAFNAL